MDALTALLESPKARGAFLLRSMFTPPWSLRVEDRAPVSVVTMVRGDAWIIPEHGTPTPLHPGDVAAVRGPRPYTLADSLATPAQVTVGPEQRCTTSAGEDVTEYMSLGIRTWGDGLHDGASVMLSGTYQAPSEIGRRLLTTMPELLVQEADAGDATLVSLLAAEIHREKLGQQLVLDRLLDLLLVSVLRNWLATDGDSAPAWYRAQGDPVVGPALRLVHENPAHAWTVAALAAKVGASRAGFARRFTSLVGQPPMAYLTSWRLTLAADLLHEPDATVDAVSRRVGYSSAFALSAAFKREHGMSPQEYRTRGQAAPPRPRGEAPRAVLLKS
ncbi:AraC family transcriptional regulator [Streptomonospora litoralis]|uniref:Xylose operon regulatory protein n=1 Tax=Streptomonospora litoralis TaxID=2498135 RepID=A0A4P6Q2P0_9ACTN|nr:AraC family transcriptional regulator [Streptomonospora litoralis]QBI54916.1 Xylose operon regulatory protein [Streptomonospora litoralis]